MKKALLKDSVKEIKNTYKRFLSILLMAFLGVGFFAGLRATSPDMIDTIDEYYDEQNVYDIQILSSLGMTDDDVNKLSQIEDVEDVTGSYETDGIIEIEDNEIIAEFITVENINQPILLSGNMPENSDECLVEEDFLTANDLQIGDTITVNIEDTINSYGQEVSYLKNNELKIVGTVKSPLYISRSRGTTNLGSGSIDYYIYISEDNINNTDIYTSVYLTVKGAKDYVTSYDEYEDYIEEVEDKIEEIEDNDTWYILDRNSNEGYVSFIQAAESIENISKVFPVVFFIVAALISLTSMTRMVEEQRMEIGTLKALGYNKFQIMRKYVLYAGLACIIGAILGMCIGFVLLPKIIWMLYCMMYQIRDNIALSFNWKYGSIGLILMSICIIGATIYTTLKELTSNPANLMRPKAPKNGSRVFLERISFIWKRLNFSHKVTIRNLFRYKKRLFMTVIGIFGCTALIVTGFGIKDSVVAIMPSQFEDIFQFNLEVNVSSTLNETEKIEFASTLEENEQISNTVPVYMASFTAINGEEQEDVQLIVPETGNDFDGIIRLRDINNKEEEIELKENELCITDKVAQLLNVEEGDTITLQNSDGKEVQITISNIVEQYVSHYIYMSSETYENLFNEEFNTNVILVEHNDISDEEQDELISELMEMSEVSGVTDIETMAASITDAMDMLNYVVIVLIIAAGLLAFVVLYNLANVNISERIRELATIKVLGFYDKEVYDYITRETIILTIIGIALGLVGGYFLNYYIMGTCELSILRFSKDINFVSYIYAIILTVVFSVIVNIATYFSLKKIDMVESLKSVE